MTRRIMYAAVAVCAGMLMLAGTAQARPAQPDYAGVCQLTVTPANPTAGDVINVSGKNFPPNGSETILLDGSQIATATADALGNFSIAVTLPSTLSAGPHTISSTCATTGVLSNTQVQVRAAAVTPVVPPAVPPLPRTGSDTKPLLIVGIGAVAAGSALVLTTRRRRRAAVAHI